MANDTNGATGEKEMVATSASPALFEDIRQPLSVPVETTIRMTAAAFCAYCLAYVDSPQWAAVLPTSLQFVIGLLGPVVVMRIPPMALTVVGTLVGFYVVLAIGLGSVTLLLLAATVSDGLFVGTVALWTLWVSGLRYGPMGQSLNILSQVFCAFFAMVGLGLHHAVRDGVTITLKPIMVEQLTTVKLPEYLSEKLGSPEAQAFILEDIRAKVTQLSEEIVLERAEGVLDKLIEYVPIILQALKNLANLVTQGCTNIEIPDEFSRILAGQAIGVCLDSDGTGDVTIELPGGTWLIKTCWTAGVMHPLAVFPNLIVVCSFTIICLNVSPLLPLPTIRTARYAVARILLPQTLQDATWYVQSNHARAAAAAATSDDNNGTQSKDAPEIDVDQWIEDERDVRKRLIGAVQLLHEGKIGLVAALEPRILDYRCGIPRNTWLPLKELASNVQHVALKALAAKVVDPVQSQEVIAEVITELQQTVTLLRDPTMTALAMKRGKGKAEATYNMVITANETITNTAAEIPLDQEGEAANDAEALTQKSDPLEFEKMAQDTTDSARIWLESMYPANSTDKNESKPLTWKDGVKHMLMTVAVWTLPSIIMCGRLVQILYLPFLAAFKEGYSATNWSTEKLFLCIKFTIGFTSLVALGVYSDGYHDLTTTKVEDDKGYELVRGSPPSSFAGWDLLAYVFATMPTTEGTVKKCFLRICGTCVGGFSAWALITFTGDNAIGSVAWLTITTAIGIYVSVDKRGAAARFGASKDYGYGGFYLVLTQAVIVMEYQRQLGARDELVGNRIFANIVGILMAVFMSMIPPRILGSKPKYTYLVLEEAIHGQRQAARMMVYGGIDRSAADMRQLKTSFLGSTNALRSDAHFLMEDAKRMNKMPFFHVNAKLEDELDMLTITCASIASVMDQCADVLASLEGPPGSPPGLLETDLQEALKAVSQGKVQADLDIDPRLEGNAAHNLVATFLILQSRLLDHQASLDSIQQVNG